MYGNCCHWICYHRTLQRSRNPRKGHHTPLWASMTRLRCPHAWMMVWKWCNEPRGDCIISDITSILSYVGDVSRTYAIWETFHTVHAHYALDKINTDISRETQVNNASWAALQLERFLLITGEVAGQTGRRFCPIVFSRLGPFCFRDLNILGGTQ